MDFFQYQNNELYAEQVAIKDIAAQYGTPCYVYSRKTLERHYRAFTDAAAQHKHLVCYAVKANSNLAVLNVLANMGAGFDIVSQGELARVLKAGGDAKKVVFSGVAKTQQEIIYALEQNIKCFNVESKAELERISEIASQMKVQAPVSIRVNPDIDAKTHPYISTGLKENKFGIDIKQAFDVYQLACALPGIKVVGVDFHIGSQLTEVEPFLAALDKVLDLVDTLKSAGITLHHLDIGGGLGVPYDGEKPPHPSAYAAQVIARLASHQELELIFEPGRAIAANAGLLVTKVEYLKPTTGKHFAIVDAGMNDMLRPSLYQAWQEIIAVSPRHDGTPEHTYDVVGPVCETGDFIGKDRTLAILPGDLLAQRSAGAYGFTMSSNYNSRPRVAEIMVDGDRAQVIRVRESLESLWQGETLLSE
ncbi:diaminopimelate decarboxylase [Pseudoalteromonas luteoviolacea]|uniref:Diaminopimelate decarboxylase n=1 Tax=Pseudoalteromonas luteoviolacea S4054 TaxID=1129367 RepID=A0A0F6AFF1_9GAMM|nr:diaminopimelate decarboxylase [Pseudoalteromonas luteoviolacea]AOT09987.1 diaminopimelate decarboxylase [Pseudoalteromonas luteoviolacea]AOT14898.1 diaminopimelate decarboxylase [Pseudoalteromonas luteoviolacea]AOT19814.1 diaminopimelate decarboxylase [Pseudoalteromonas luteoviolacea]KKE84935.1 diaminopimelate decarboxylase [Pseudoalteromonas luteoviolacea S4054]KZN72552.1 diaminopimelate decarboxylase [Pseudoalteromonas luteoviolacea S4047-1]